MIPWGRDLGSVGAGGGTSGVVCEGLGFRPPPMPRDLQELSDDVGTETSPLRLRP